MAVLAKLQWCSRWQYIVALLLFSAFLTTIGHIQVLPVFLIVSLPVFIYFRWVYSHQENYNVSYAFVSTQLFILVTLISYCMAVNRDSEIEQLFWIFLAGGFVNTALALGAQLSLSLVLARLCFYDQWNSIRDQLNKYFHPAVGSHLALKKHVKLGEILTKLELEKTLGYFVFLFAVAYIVAGLVEEFLKYWIVQGSCKCPGSTSSRYLGRLVACCKGTNESLPAFTARKKRQQRRDARKGRMCHPSRLCVFSQRPHATNAFVVFLAVVAGALGFSVMENVGFALGARTFQEKMESAVLRGILSTPLHSICGGITGIRMAERVLATRCGSRSSTQRSVSALKADLGRWSTKLVILFPAIIIHGTFDMGLLVLMILVSDANEAAHPLFYQTVLPTIVSLGVLVPSLVFLRWKFHAFADKIFETQYVHVAVELESGERLKAESGGKDAIGSFGGDYEDDDSGAEAEGSVQEVSRQVRSVFEM
ncbi:hypothetical protein PsorP6_015313 [Peronosclerospora sorghi]|uniref:Uncharacterized protein n=1 Tax=Peronosclerospora sorghi TaxID=230839 RepID=A0ACC0VRU3_9STRA|nr:hypothetical protein PsorP6_015313 [Peronosclerospora sorghi]